MHTPALPPSFEPLATVLQGAEFSIFAAKSGIVGLQHHFQA